MRPLGILLLAVGAILLFFGFQASGSVGSQVKQAFAGIPTDKAVWFIVAGGASAALGAYFSFANGRG